MNISEITTDGKCVYLINRNIAGTTLKVIIRLAFVSLVTGVFMSMFSKGNTFYSFLGLILLLGGILTLLPLARTILWNMYGEEYLSISTKSVAQQINFGWFLLPRETFEFEQTLRLDIEILRDENGVQEGFIHFYSYDKNNQPYHLLQSKAYVQQEKYVKLVSQVNLLFEKEDMESRTIYVKLKD
ncbi:MAG: hypothetical protein IT236_13565 [Bacteroidia bacterium]|nr:hypothetical protein [Bacteroidia bacterium]